MDCTGAAAAAVVGTGVGGGLDLGSLQEEGLDGC